MTKRFYYEVEVTFENPMWLNSSTFKDREICLFAPEHYVEELDLIKNKISPYSKLRILRKVRNVKRWRGF